ncbi:MAG: hypothetical protein U9Q15_05670 [Patescibacteria group bacterium]|nr:hypothetical protein [Patescibacteria group bacterium]
MSVAALFQQSLSLIFEYLAVGFAIAFLTMPFFWIIRKIWQLITGGFVSWTR